MWSEHLARCLRVGQESREAIYFLMMGQKGSSDNNDRLGEGRKTKRCELSDAKLEKALRKLEGRDNSCSDALNKSHVKPDARISSNDVCGLEHSSKQLKDGEGFKKSGSRARHRHHLSQECCVGSMEGNVNEAHNNYVTGAIGRRASDSNNSAPVHGENPYSAESGGMQNLLRCIFTPIQSQYIKVSHLQASIDKKLTTIDERSPAVLKYKTPHFRASATVDVPALSAGDNLQIGWIQVCTDMHFINLYGQEGLTSWEFPEIVSGSYRMISDADGKQYPWYGSVEEVRTVKGPTAGPLQIDVNMNDNFYPQVTWYIPLSGYTQYPELTNIYRNQHFYAFLTLRDLNTQKFRILRAVSWSMQLAIDVDPTLPLGRRAKLVGPYEQVQPRILDDVDAIAPLVLENYALNPPNANNAQVLIWRPRVGQPRVVVPPVQTTIDIDEYVEATKPYSRALEQIARKVFGIVQ